MEVFFSIVQGQDALKISKKCLPNYLTIEK